MYVMYVCVHIYMYIASSTLDGIWLCSQLMGT